MHIAPQIDKVDGEVVGHVCRRGRLPCQVSVASSWVDLTSDHINGEGRAADCGGSTRASSVIVRTVDSQSVGAGDSWSDLHLIQTIRSVRARGC